MSYRDAGSRFIPACPHCMTSIWMVFDGLWAFWICAVCGEWVEPYLAAPSGSDDR